METSGAELGAGDVEGLLRESGIAGLAEMMNFPGVLNGNQEVLEKIRAASGRPVDGHAPGLSGKALNAYIAAGISSDHECTTASEAREKLNAGMHIMIREGSTAKNLEALLPLVNHHSSSRFMIVTDDVHTEDLLAGHLNIRLKKAVKLGLDPVTALKMVTINPARYFRLGGIGAIAPGYQADIVVLDNLKEFMPVGVYKKGVLAAAAEKQVKEWPVKNLPLITGMNVCLPEDPFRIKVRDGVLKVIGVVPGQIVTRKITGRTDRQN